MIKVRIIGTDGNEYNTTALVDPRTTPSTLKLIAKNAKNFSQHMRKPT